MSDKNKQELLTVLYQIFSMSGAFTEVKQLDKLRTLTGKLSNVMADQAKHEAVELMRSLQKAVTSGFKKTFAATIDLEKRIVDLEEKVNDCMCHGSNQGKDREDTSDNTKSEHTG